MVLFNYGGKEKKYFQLYVVISKKMRYKNLKSKNEALSPP